MSTKVEKRIVVNVPVSTAYNQWTRFEEFPHFMGGVESVRRLEEDRLEWTAHIAGVRRKWQARILEQIPDRKVAWASIEGATNSGAVEFESAGDGGTALVLTLEYQPHGVVEKAADMLHIVERQAEADLKKFKEFVEHEGYAAQAWRDSGTATASGTGATAGTGAAGAGAVGAAQPEYNRFAHPFDQTNGLVDLEGESDGTAEGEAHSAGERKRQQNRRDDYLKPPGGTLGRY